MNLWKPGFDPWSVHVGFAVDRVAMGQVFPRVLWFSHQFHSTGAPFLGKTKKLIIFITGLPNKPVDCGASIQSAAGPFTKKKKQQQMNEFNLLSRDISESLQ
jgi:hypothetical protein